jgi:hypothetical protein
MLNQIQISPTINNHLKNDDVESAFVDLVHNYHRQALTQASILFWFSLVVGTLGFILISYAVIMSPNIKEAQLLLRAIPGTVLEIIAGLFFRQAKEVRCRATELYDKLRADKQQADAIALADSIDDIMIKSAVKAHLAKKMITRRPIH